MTFTQSIKTVFSKYATFDGRARRREYWWFALFRLLINAFFYITIMAILASLNDNDNAFSMSAILIVFVLYSIINLAILLPSIAVLVRRLHDIGKDGLYFLLYFVPLIGQIFLIVLMIQDSDPEENAFGPNPKTNI